MNYIRSLGSLVILLVVGLLLTTPINAFANWWDKFGEPEYGGTLTFQAGNFNPFFDNIRLFSGTGQQLWYERLWTNDWTLDREVYGFNVDFAPQEYVKGLLAESWEIPDAQTIIVHINKDAKWQDKPPVNGRNFTAYDVEYHYDRMMGTGHGFTKPSEWYTAYTTNWEKVTAQDEGTVVFKFKEPSSLSFLEILDPYSLNTFEAREWVELGEEARNDWHTVVGTSPWMLADYVDGVSITYNPNPNYWGYDERHPENTPPYVDELKFLSITDVSTALAALRTGKIDMMTDIGREQAESLRRTNPELEQAKLLRNSPAVLLRCDKEPFTDIRVRKALEMAIDRTEIAEAYYGGEVDGKPCGLVSPAIKGYCFPYDEWPEALKEEYSYNPERARELLAEAGHPDGFDAKIVAPSISDMQLLQIIQSKFLDIGITMKIEPLDFGAFFAFAAAGKHEQMLYWSTGDPFPPTNTLWKRYSQNLAANYTYNNDPAYDAILEEIINASDWAEVKQKMVEADRYSIEKHWAITTCPAVRYIFYQPYLKGYSGESQVINWGCQHILARLWIDQDSKESLGR